MCSVCGPSAIPAEPGERSRRESVCLSGVTGMSFTIDDGMKCNL